MTISKNLKIGLIVAAVALAAVSIGAVQYTSQTGFCNSCHEMNESYTGWQASAHQNLHCYDCHTDEGIVAKAKVKVNGLKEVYIHFTEDVNMDNVKSDVPDSRCTKCHDFTEKGKYHERITAFHLQHRDFKYECVTCHSQSGHGKDSFTGFKEESCQKCHNPQKI